MKKSLLLVFALNLIILAFAPKAIANTGLSISPPTIELLIAPNKNVVQNISLQNLSEAASYQVSLHRLIPVGEDGGSTIDLNPLDPTTIPFVFTFPTSLTLKANESTTFSLTIAAASTDVSQAFPLALAFTSQTALGSASHAQPIVALPLLLTISPDGALDLSITLENFELPVIADSMLPTTINPKLHNASHFMHRPGGELVITAPNKTKNIFTITPTLILGETIRRVSFDKSPTLPATISRFGPHTFAFTLTTPSGKTILTSERVVWFLPLRLILTILGFVLIIFALYLRKKRAKHSAH